MLEEATIHPDGTTTFAKYDGNKEFPNVGTDSSGYAKESANNAFHEQGDNGIPEATKGSIDPALFLFMSFFILAGIWYYMYLRGKRQREHREAFFMGMDGDKFNIKLPKAVDEYYEIKAKCEEAGWAPGKLTSNPQEASQGPARIIAQALMKRAIADIPIVTQIQKESAGMNKLYSQSMCSVKQWKTYQAAEALVSSEVEEVRIEANIIETGWSEVIWRQAMQYHNMLKNKHEMEAKQRLALAEKAKADEEENMKPKTTPEELQKAKEVAAEKAAEELLRMEEREKESKKSFSNNGMKKGFLDKKGKNK